MYSTNYNGRRVNDNLLKVAIENNDIKRLLRVALQTSKPKKYKNGVSSYYDSYCDMVLYANHTSRKDLLRTCILLATSRNHIAQENLIDVVSARLGEINEKDYKYIAELIYLKNPKIVEHVNDYLAYHLKGFAELHKRFTEHYYGI